MKQQPEKPIDEFLAELSAKISLRGKDVKTDYMSFHGKRGHRVKARRYGLKTNKSRHPWKGAT